MLSCIIARVGPHCDIEELAKWSTVPVLNALSDRYHPFQAVTDLLTMAEIRASKNGPDLGLENLKIAWIGDPTNVLVDLAIGAMKLGIHLAVATPEEYKIPDDIRAIIQDAADSSPHPGTLIETTVPEDAVKGACFLINDTWTSMGQEEEKAKRTKAFRRYRITNELAKRGGADPDWKYMHCLPRYLEEVDDAVMYGPRSKVFEQSANRLWAAVSVIHSFVVERGHIEHVS
jgi:ornithine carbamoyltransferase